MGKIYYFWRPSLGFNVKNSKTQLTDSHKILSILVLVRIIFLPRFIVKIYLNQEIF